MKTPLWKPSKEVIKNANVPRFIEYVNKKQGKKLYDQAESCAGKRKAMEQAVAQIVSASDTPETKLQKIYARVQQVRNTSYERAKTEQEQKRDKEKDINNVEDLRKRGYGRFDQIA